MITLTQNTVVGYNMQRSCTKMHIKYCKQVINDTSTVVLVSSIHISVYKVGN